MDLFKQYLRLETAEMQLLTSIINFPWSIKVVYGLLADNVPLCGSKRRSYIGLNGVLQFLMLLPLVPAGFIESKYLVTLFLTLYAVNVAFNDAIIDALIVMQSRRDEKYGSSDLNSFSWGWLSLGGITGSVTAGYLTEFLNPRVSFLICAILGLLVALLGGTMSPKVESDPILE